MYRDNIMKVNSVPKLCYEPMDIVYTWVNGSDPLHKKFVKQYTLLEKENEKLEDKFDTSIKTEPSTSSTNEKSNSNQKSNTNNYHLKGADNDLKTDTKSHKTKTAVKRRRLLAVKTNQKQAKNTRNSKKTTKKFDTKPKSAPKQKAQKKQVNKKQTKPPKTKVETKVEKIQETQKKTETKTDTVKKTETKTKTSTKKSKKTPTVKNSGTLNNSTSTNKNATKTDDTNGSNRFRDNDELRYSLRSLERFAPWVRNVYIVTSGQVPNWLNVKNPKVKIVKHADIYRNPTHLPVFSSPSIESQIHRIPGLSKKFIYLNDDVMFGNDVYPEDFYSHSTGQKVFLSWEVPPCHEGCQESWLGDGYCDVSCNVTQCDFDGGDCVGPNVRFSYGSSSSSSYGSYGNYGSYSNSNNNFWSSTNTKNYCAASCSDSWIGDRFCDRPCNVKECGYDAGDCEFKELKSELEYVTLENDISVVYVRHLEPSIYLDLNKVFNEAQITNGNHENEKLVRSSTISQKEKLLIFTFNYQNLNVNITKYSNSSNFFEEHIPVSLEAERVINVTTRLDSLQNTQSTTFDQSSTKLTITKSFTVKIVSNHTFNYIVNKLNLSNETSILGIKEKQENDLNLDNNYQKLLVIPTYFSKSQLNGIAKNNNKTKTLTNKTTSNESISGSGWLDSWKQINSKTDKSTDEVIGDAKATEIDDISENVVKNNVPTLAADTKAVVNNTKLERKVTVQTNLTNNEQVSKVETLTMTNNELTKKEEITKKNQKPTEIDDISENVIKSNANTPELEEKTPQDPTTEDNYNIKNLNTDELKYLKRLLKKRSRKLLSVSPTNIQSSYSNRIPIVQSHPEEIINSLRFNLAEKEKTQEQYENIKKRIEREIKNENYDSTTSTTIEQTKDNTSIRVGRRLLDKFGDSLIHVNKLLNREYGRASRKVPAHMPHMIDRDIMFELQKKWEYEFNVTSSNRFRSSSDMQYTFTYFYYLMHEGFPYNVSRFLREHVDTNNDAVMDNYEIRNLANIMYHKYKIPLAKVTELYNNITISITSFNEELMKDSGKVKKPKKKTKAKKKNPSITAPSNTTTNSTQSTDDEFGSYFWASTKSSKKWKSWSYYDDFSEFKEYHQTVRNVLFAHLNYTKLVLSRYQTDISSFRSQPIVDDYVNSGLSDIVKPKVHRSEQRFPFTLEDLSQVGFHMIRDDEDKVGDQLDELRRNRPKFICLNDDMNQTKPNERVVEMLHNFYNWYFPNVSQFELPETEENPFLYIDQLMEHYNTVRYNRYIYDAIVVAVVCFICCCCLIIRKVFKSKSGNKNGRNFKNPTNMGIEEPTISGQPVANAGNSSSIGIGSHSLTHHRNINIEKKPEIV